MLLHVLLNTYFTTKDTGCTHLVAIVKTTTNLDTPWGHTMGSPVCILAEDPHASFGPGQFIIKDSIQR